MPEAPSKQLATRLRTAREDAGLSQAELARRLGVSQAAVSTWESGTRQPGVDDLYAVAAELDVEVHDLLPRRAGPPVRAALRAVAEKLELASLGRAMEDFLDAAEASPRGERKVWTRAEDPAEAAGELLETLGFTKPPVDAEAVARTCGIPVLEWPFDDALSGLVVETASGPVIGVNVGHVTNRKRFTVAHELGHVALRHLDSFHVDLGTSTQDGDPPGYNWRHERAANEFAAALLMPASLVRQVFSKTPSVPALAKTFAVSELAMGFRLENLGLK